MTDELALERRAARLQGETLTRAVYQQLRWSGESPAWSGTAPHPVELAVHLETASGRRFRIRWADELGLRHGFGIAVDPVRVVDPAEGPLHDVSRCPPWADRLGRRIERALVHWREIYPALRSSLSAGVAIHADHLSRPDFPQTLELDFGADPTSAPTPELGFEPGTALTAAPPTPEGGGVVLIAAARLLDDGRAVGFCNHLLVLFERVELELLGLR